MRAVWVEEDEKKSIRLAFFGSLFGALAFGCRPPVALANLFVIPMLVVYLKKHKFTKKLFGGACGCGAAVRCYRNSSDVL